MNKCNCVILYRNINDELALFLKSNDCQFSFPFDSEEEQTPKIHIVGVLHPISLNLNLLNSEDADHQKKWVEREANQNFAS